MEYMIIYKSKKFKLEGYTNDNVNVLIDHYRFLSESLTRRVDRELNKIFPKMFYKVEPIKEKLRTGIKVVVLDDYVGNTIEKFLTFNKVKEIDKNFIRLEREMKENDYKRIPREE